MQVLIQSTAIEQALIGLMRSHDRYRWAVAWASTGFNAWDVLERHKSRIQQIVIGTHFHQTHPDAISSLHRSPGVRFVTDRSGVFHHKIYLFEKDDGPWSAIVGSANFTGSAFSANDESAVMFSSRDPGAAGAKQQLDQAIDDSWKKATDKLNPEWLRWYTQMWKQKQERLRRLAGRFGRKPNRTRRHDVHEFARSAGDIALLSMSWDKYLRLLRDKSETEDIRERLTCLEAAKAIFKKTPDFGRMSIDDRHRVTSTGRVKALSAQNHINWKCFGNMFGNGNFKHHVNQSQRLIQNALQHIAMEGEVTRDDYVSFASEIQSLKGISLGAVTRLLSMKRPDVFVPWNNANARLFKNSFGLKGVIDFDDYWDCVIARIQEEALWLNSPCPTSELGRRIWHGRSAMLDAIFYE